MQNIGIQNSENLGLASTCLRDPRDMAWDGIPFAFVLLLSFVLLYNFVRLKMTKEEKNKQKIQKRIVYLSFALVVAVLINFIIDIYFGY